MRRMAWPRQLMEASSRWRGASAPCTALRKVADDRSSRGRHDVRHQSSAWAIPHMLALRSAPPRAVTATRVDSPKKPFCTRSSRRTFLPCASARRSTVDCRSSVIVARYPPSPSDRIAAQPGVCAGGLRCRIERGFSRRSGPEARWRRSQSVTAFARAGRRCSAIAHSAAPSRIQ